MGLVGLGCIVYIFRGSSFGKGNLDFRGRLSRHILIDVMCMFVGAFVNFGYPDMPLANIVSCYCNTINNGSTLNAKALLSKVVLKLYSKLYNRCIVS